MDDLIYKIVPHSYTYPHPSYRFLTRDGLRLKLDISDFLGHAIYFGYQNEEAQSYELLFQLVKQGYHCLDVGTNIGYVSLRMASLVGNGQVFGFEPDPVNYSRAIENLNLNNPSNLKIFPWGLGESESTATMEVRAVHNLGGNRIARPGATGATVTVRVLDEVVASEGIKRVDLMKIDVEGYELKVLRGAKKLLTISHPVLFVEINDDNLKYQGDSATGVIEFLTQVGYRHFINTGTGKPVDTQTDFRGLHFDLIARP